MEETISGQFNGLDKLAHQGPFSVINAKKNKIRHSHISRMAGRTNFIDLSLGAEYPSFILVVIRNKKAKKPAIYCEYLEAEYATFAK